MRYRYALFDDDRVECFEDDPQVRKNLIWSGAKAFSVYAFSGRLGNSVSPSFVLGDLHMYFPFHKTEFFIDILYRYRVPHSAIHVYKHYGLHELVVSEEAFRGDLPYANRIEIDNSLREYFDASPSKDRYSTIEGWNVLFTNFEMLGLESNVSLSSLSKKYNRETSSGVSLLHTLFLSFNFKVNKGVNPFPQDKIYLKQCGVLRGLLSSEFISSFEFCTFSNLFKDGRVGLSKFLNESRRFERDGEDYSEELVGDITDTPLWCCDVPKFLAEKGSTLKCKGSCGVSTPEAFIYAAYPPELVTLNEKHGGFLLTRTGLFVKTDDFMGGTVKICPPIWVEECHSGILNGFGARTVVFYDIDGNRKSLTIDERDLDSPKLFALLRSHRFECPTGKTEKGLLREFLLQQYPKRDNPEAAVAVRASGWQKKGFVFPLSEFRSPSYRLKSVILPPESIDNLRFDRFDYKRNWSPEEELAACFSLISPLLNFIKSKGICLHFHGGSKQNRDSILSAVNYVWGDVLIPKVCSADDLKNNVVALKKLHTDLPLCVCEVGEANEAQKKMRTFLRRYFLGRKGADEGIHGVVISTGNMPLAPEKDRRMGRNGYVHQKNVLLIDIPVGAIDFSIYEKLPADFSQMAVQKIQENKERFAEVLKSVHKEFKCQLVVRSSSKFFAEIVRIFSMVYCAEYYLIGDKELAVPTCFGAASLRHIGFVRKLDLEANYFMPEARHLFGVCGQIFSLGFVLVISSLGPSLPKLNFIATKSYIIIAADDFKELYGENFPFGTYTAWLKRKNVLKPFKGGDLCGVHHFPKLNKSVRSYKVILKKLYQLAQN
ncbi:hypothetical protein [Maridesulfovibrio ferrireducens]|uniref:hypothetical protein n=1 Tax=Maridesulfovibrio ferrireducens TaxID=246191 RepID=UPI001A2AA53D|nr:hypothetical protein [Maridesulfovibrio ferrireducens]MBI9111485.1 DUF927 domain-containing protein [Maridesulfovibrio ferrireducens]